MNITGLHHVTAIATDPQRNLDFYAGILGLRLVKRTVNFDDPGAYHFYFGDAAGTPGTIMTFFPWPHARRGTRGSGEVEATAFAVPAESIGYWAGRLEARGVKVESLTKRLGEEVIRFRDPDAMPIELVATAREFATAVWQEGPVPAEHAIRGFHSVSAALDDVTDTVALLTGTFGYRLAEQEGARVRLVSADSAAPGNRIDLVTLPDAAPARIAAGSVHHIAFRAADDDTQLAWREKIQALGLGVSPVMDRSYFHSIYFREPGGILFEIATDDPGFAIDEDASELGTHLRLPPWMENSRERIEQILPKITLPSTTPV